MVTALLRLAAVAALPAVAVASLASAPLTAGATTHATHVYVNDNTAVVNTVAAFTQQADGSLVAVAGSPFPAGGAGTGTAVGSQGSLQATADGRFLLAVDAGSNEISVLRIRTDGSLVEVPGGRVPSGGIEPVSVAIHGNLVYVANEGNGTTGSNYTGFRLNPVGMLVPIPHSTIPLPATANPGDILFNPTGAHLAAVEVGTTEPSSFRIDSFTVGADGRLDAAPGSPFPAQSAGPFGSEFSPVQTDHLYVSNAHAGPGAGTVSAFDVATDGSLISIGGSPYADGQTAPCWVEISHDGRFLFAVNTASTTISSYSINGDGSLSLLGSTPFKSGTGIRPFDARLDPSGGHLYVVDAALDAVTGFAVSGGSLSELAASPFALPAGATPFGLVSV